MSERVNTWAAAHPQTLRYFDLLNENNIPWGIFSGLAVHFLNGRPTADTDLLIPRGRLEQAADLLPGGNVVHKLVRVQAGDGVVISYGAYELTAMLDDTELQIMEPSSPITDGKNVYELSLTPLAASHRSAHNVDGTGVYVAPSFDSLAAKSMLQRREDQHKLDVVDSIELAAHCDLLSPYSRSRAREIGLTSREVAFMQSCGAVALVPSTDPKYALVA